MLLNAESGQIREVYAYFGLPMCQAQNLERQLAMRSEYFVGCCVRLSFLYFRRRPHSLALGMSFSDSRSTMG